MEINCEKTGLNWQYAQLDSSRYLGNGNSSCSIQEYGIL